MGSEEEVLGGGGGEGVNIFLSTHTLSELHMTLQMLCLSPGNSFVDPPISGIKSYYHLVHISIKVLDPPTSNDNEHQ